MVRVVALSRVNLTHFELQSKVHANQFRVFFLISAQNYLLSTGTLIFIAIEGRNPTAGEKSFYVKLHVNVSGF